MARVPAAIPLAPWLVTCFQSQRQMSTITLCHLLPICQLALDFIGSNILDQCSKWNLVKGPYTVYCPHQYIHVSLQKPKLI